MNKEDPYFKLSNGVSFFEEVFLVGDFNGMVANILRQINHPLWL